MATMTTVEARENFAEVVSRTAFGKERVVLTRYGKPVGALVPMEDMQLLEQLEKAINVRESDLALKETRKHGTKRLRQLIKELGL